MKHLDAVIVVLIIIVLLLFAILIMLLPIAQSNKADLVAFFVICIGIIMALFVAAHVGAWVGRFFVWLFLENAESREASAHTRPTKELPLVKPATSEFAKRATAKRADFNGRDLAEGQEIEEGKKERVGVGGGRDLVEFPVILIVSILLAIGTGIGYGGIGPRGNLKSENQSFED